MLKNKWGIFSDKSGTFLLTITPLENKALLPQQKVIPFRNDLKMLDAALKKGGASNG